MDNYGGCEIMSKIILPYTEDSILQGLLSSICSFLHSDSSSATICIPSWTVSKALNLFVDFYFRKFLMCIHLLYKMGS